MMKKLFQYLSLTISVYIYITLLVTNTLQAQPTISLNEQKSFGVLTQELIDLVEKSSSLKSMLINSIQKAKMINPDKKTNPAQTLLEYYDFVNHAETAMPWNILEYNDYPTLHEQLLQNIIYFYFIIDQPIEELKGKGYYHNSLQYHEPFRSWVIKFVKAWGQYLDTDKSWNDNYYKKVYNDKLFGLQKNWYESPSNWKTFNEFFARYLISPTARPISQKDNINVIISPADSTPQNIWGIDKNSFIESDNGVLVKTSKFRSIAKLLGEDSPYKNAFANGKFIHSYLSVYDYHRYHAPVSGIVKEVKIISQDNASGGIVTWDKTLQKYILESYEPGWQTIETRGVLIVDTGTHGLVAFCPIGMSQVSSVNFEKNIKVGTHIKKGDMIGYFLFGGSDFIMLFQENSGFQLTALKNNKKENHYKHMLMGEELGIFSKN